MPKQHKVTRRALLAAGLAGLALPLSSELVAAADEATASATVLRYYKLINARKFDAAFHLWSLADDGTNALGQTAQSFAAGYSTTARVKVVLGPESEPDGAAGSVFVTVPVSLVSTAKSGKVTRFRGEFTLRKSNVEGGERNWRIFRATLRRAG